MDWTVCGETLRSGLKTKTAHLHHMWIVSVGRRKAARLEEMKLRTTWARKRQNELMSVRMIGQARTLIQNHRNVIGSVAAIRMTPRRQDRRTRRKSRLERSSLLFGKIKIEH